MRNTSKYNKIFLSMLIASYALLAPKVQANAEIQLIDAVPIQKTRTTISASALVDKRLLASTGFDLREEITVRVKDQKTTNTCWTFASNTVLETNLLLTKNQTYDFSERHMEYATTKTFSDGTNTLGHNRELNGGGNASIAMGYYVSGRGPVLETEMPFSTTQSKIALSEIDGKTVQKKITDYAIFPEVLKTKDTEGNITYSNEAKTITYTKEQVEANREKIKQHIMNYGAVAAMTLSGSEYSEYYNLNSEYPAFYCDNANLGLNHQITIIGWNDTYPVTNFNPEHQPSEPGAYLVMNSYGTEGNFKNGCYYVSYEDAYIELGIIGIINTEDIDYDKIYQHDPLGLANGITYGNNDVLYGANIFSRNKNEAEQIEEISIASILEQNIEVYINSKDGELTQNKLVKIETDKTTIRQGYTTIKLKNPVKLTGDKFVVAVKYSGNGSKAGIGVENPTQGYWATAKSNAGESYFSTDMVTWKDLSTVGVSNTNICLKAFTTKIISSDTYAVEEDLIYKISPSTTVKDFKTKLQLSNDDKIFKDNKELKDNDLVTTNSKLITNNDKTYTLVVTGDTSGTGDITITDVAKVQLHFVNLEKLTGAYLKAADTNFSSDITITDVARAQLAFLGLISI